MANDGWQVTDGKWQMAEEQGSSAPLSFVMFHLPCWLHQGPWIMA
jgi:hypothetical protein